MKIYNNGVLIGSSLLGYEGGLLDNFFGVKVSSKLLPNCVLAVTLPERTIHLDVVFED